MSAQLYRPGSKHTINGVSCDILTCSIQSVEPMLKEGWFASPDDFNEPDNSNPDDEAKPDEIRALAKDAKIDGWESKRIATLVKELEALTSGD